MPEYDLVIRGGTVVEGTGVPRYRSDVAVKNGRIAMIGGKIMAAGAREVEASGCYVAPGAIDLHCHYDGQLNWDPYASLSGWFGVTSLTNGMCGFGFAPTRPQERDRAMRLMNRVEAIPLESMRRGMRWDWETFPEYLGSMERQGLGINVAQLFPFSPLRGYVLGVEAARERTRVTDSELNRMKQLFHEGMRAGAFGIAGNQTQEDRNEDGGPLPSHVASKEEWLGLAEVLGEFGIGQLGWTAPNIGSEAIVSPEETRQLLADMMRLSGRPLNLAMQMDPDATAWMEGVYAQGLGPVVLQQALMPTWAEFRLAEYNLFDYMPSWREPLVGTPQQRAEKLRDPAVRAAMQRDVDARPGVVNTDYNGIWVAETVHQRNRKYVGKSIAEIARLENKAPLDAWLDLALDEGLETVFTHFIFTDVIGEKAEIELEKGIKSPYTHISLSDGGAHVRYLTISTWPVYFLCHWVRDKGIMSLEQAVFKMSTWPAWLAGFKDRGMLRIGAWADIIVYDLDSLGFMYDRPIYATDFPGEERRLVQKPRGLRYIVVNGAVTFEENRCTGALPGNLLRSYDMVG